MFDESRHLLLVLEAGTFTAAARRAHLSQPALSASIRRLEDKVGARLLHRGRGIAATPTAAGEAFARHARQALAAFESGIREVAELQGLARGVVRVGAGATACTYLLPPIIRAFRADHPGVMVRLREARTDAVLAALSGGDIDLGLITGDRPIPAGMGATAWRDDELVLVGPPQVQAEDARALPFVTFTAGSPTRALLDGLFPDAVIAMELGNIAAIKAHVRAGVGRSFVSRAAVSADIEARRLVILDHDLTPARRTLQCVHRGTERLPPAARALLTRLVGCSDGE